MNFLQKIYDAIKGFKTPTWLRLFLKDIQDIIVSVLLQVGTEYLAQLQAKVIEVSKKNMSNNEKFRIVFDFGKKLLPNIKESMLNLIIEMIVNRYKQNKVI